MSADVNRLVAEFDGQQVGGTVIVYEDGKHKEAAVNKEGTWVISDEFRERLAAAPAPSKKAPK